VIRRHDGNTSLQVGKETCNAIMSMDDVRLEIPYGMTKPYVGIVIASNSDPFGMDGIIMADVKQLESVSQPFYLMNLIRDEGGGFSMVVS
jgi:hypothetical protein